MAVLKNHMHTNYTIPSPLILPCMWESHLHKHTDHMKVVDTGMCYIYLVHFSMGISFFV